MQQSASIQLRTSPVKFAVRLELACALLWNRFCPRLRPPRPARRRSGGARRPALRRRRPRSGIPTRPSSAGAARRCRQSQPLRRHQLAVRYPKWQVDKCFGDSLAPTPIVARNSATFSGSQKIQRRNTSSCAFDSTHLEQIPKTKRVLNQRVFC